MKYDDRYEQPGKCSGYTLSTGRQFDACSDRLSLDESGILAWGYDSRVDEFEDAPLTDAEKFEIASEVIGRWMRWAPPPQQGIMTRAPPGSLPSMYPFPVLREHLRIVRNGSGVRVERITIEGDWILASLTIPTEEEARRMIEATFRFGTSDTTSVKTTAPTIPTNDRLSKAVCFDGIPPCEEYPDGVCISKIELKNGVRVDDLWMVVDPATNRVRGHNGMWLDGDSQDKDADACELTLDQAFAVVDELKKIL